MKKKDKKTNVQEKARCTLLHIGPRYYKN